MTHPEVECPRWDEADRLRALKQYGVLDTTPEASFDDIANLAARICGTAMAAVSLVDAERQWFKAEVGLGDPTVCLYFYARDMVNHEDLDPFLAVEMPFELLDRMTAIFGNAISRTEEA